MSTFTSSLTISSLRPRPLGSSLWAFLFPHVPFVPSIPKDVSDTGRSPAGDAHLFPSDEQLSQRTLWICFLIVLGWTFLGLGGALPLYLVSTPCLAQSASPGNFSGVYSTLQDLSLLRLLQLYDNSNVTTTNIKGLHTRAIVNDDLAHNTYIRLIVLTVLVLGLALFPALWKILHEFNKMVAYRRRWITVKCEGKEMAWLSARDAPGFVGWGEKRLKTFILKSGLSNTFDGRNGARRGQQEDAERPLTREEEANLEVDVQSLFSIGETHRLALLIEDRDEILENLEIAEARYITSFRLSTPDPSIADFELPPIPESKDRPYISRPRALAGAVTTRRRGRRHNPAYAASSLAPTSFVAPSQYYKLRGLQGVSGGRFDTGSEQNLSDSIHQRVVGTRFQEVNRNADDYGRLPIGSPVRLEKTGELGPGSPGSPPMSELRHGPNYDQESWIQGGPSRFVEPHLRYVETPDGEHTDSPGDLEDDEWVDLVREAPVDFNEDYNVMQPSVSTPLPGGYEEMGVARRRLPKIFQARQDSARRETFPLRNRAHDTSGDTDLVPPHLRLQQQQPFVRPVSGINHDDLGSVYGDISQWRSKLKSINAAIEEAQHNAYSDIADGARVRGWLMIGRGLRFIPGAQPIEGRAKEDIRWDVLQNERSTLDSAVLWTVISIVVVLLAVGRSCIQLSFLIHAHSYFQ